MVHNTCLLIHNAIQVFKNQVFQSLMNLCILLLFGVSYQPFSQRKLIFEDQQFYLIFQELVLSWLKMDFDKQIGVKWYYPKYTAAMNIC